MITSSNERHQCKVTKTPKKSGIYDTMEGTQYISSNQPPKMEIYELSGKEFKIITLNKFSELPEKTCNSMKSGKQYMDKVQQQDRGYKNMYQNSVSG